MSNPPNLINLSHKIAPNLLNAFSYQTPITEFYKKATYMRKRNDPGSLDFTLGDSHEMPLPGLVESLQKASIPQQKGWYGYKGNLSKTRAVICDALQQQRGLIFDPEDIFLTNGTVVGLAICLKLLVQEGDEVIINLPPWLGYRSMIHYTGATPIGVPVISSTFDLDLEKIAAQITEKTRAIIINSPHNPTGKIFSEDRLQQLADLLLDASHRYSNPIYLISDETFSRIVFDDQNCPSPTKFYPFSFFVYGYSKTWMAPGQRIGYIALPPTMPNREQIRQLIARLQGSAFGWCFPSALMQYALKDLEKLNLNIKHLEDKRDWMIKELTEIGYEVNSPQGTFFLLVKSPNKDDCTFAELLADYGLFVLPGTPQEIPGYFRLSLTASEEMITQALPKFRAALNIATR